MIDKKQLNVRIDADLYQQIINSGQSRAQVVTAALRKHFDVNEQQDDSMMVSALSGQLQEKDRQISELHIMLQNAISQNMITAPDDPHKKSWWMFWR
jgi:hypothetical protein